MRRSAVMRRDREEMIRRARSMTPEERLVAFYHHARLVTKFYLAGERFRARQRLRSRKPRTQR